MAQETQAGMVVYARMIIGVTALHSLQVHDRAICLFAWSTVPKVIRSSFWRALRKMINTRHVTGRWPAVTAS